MTEAKFTRDVCVVGGAGHVGLPLALTFADCGLRTVIYDMNDAVLQEIGQNRMPFMEEGASEVLDRVLKSGMLELERGPSLLRECESIVMVIGTPVDEHLNPQFIGIQRALEPCEEFMRDGQLLVLRSTVFPGISRFVDRHLGKLGLDIDVAFCPERVAQGKSLSEFRTLPQIISGFNPRTLERVRALFGRFVADFVEMEPMEAELCKLMTNAWRYIQFATVNQFYMIATQHGLDFDRILHGCRHNYPRMQGMPGPGLTAGPCLVKDTMQLAAFSQNNFVLGHAAMLVNEGLPNHLLKLAKDRFDLSAAPSGILGMAFKAESDDRRDSLSYKLRKLLMLESPSVLCSDPYVPDPTFVSPERVLQECGVVFIGAPHRTYASLQIPQSLPVIDVWGVTARHS